MGAIRLVAHWVVLRLEVELICGSQCETFTPQQCFLDTVEGARIHLHVHHEPLTDLTNLRGKLDIFFA